MFSSYLQSAVPGGGAGVWKPAHNGAQRQAKLERAAAKECGSWLSMARSLARAGGNEAARRYYRKVVEGYPDTKYAKTAREEMDRLPR